VRKIPDLTVKVLTAMATIEDRGCEKFKFFFSPWCIQFQRSILRNTVQLIMFIFGLVKNCFSRGGGAAYVRYALISECIVPEVTHLTSFSYRKWRDGKPGYITLIKIINFDQTSSHVF
jgi:hypothetical protein